MNVDGGAEQQKMLDIVAAKRKADGPCSVFRRLPNDRSEQIIAYLYILLDLIQETTSPFSVQLVSAAESYRGATYGDPVLDRA